MKTQVFVFLVVVFAPFASDRPVAAQQAGTTVPPGAIANPQRHLNNIRREFEASGLKAGSRFPAIDLYDEKGKPFNTKTLKGQYTVLVTGCVT
jgi:cytochrome oxidase Cu insertion factor (SCO1/SenC/PrrC family)